jgi:hypothetical protein
MKIGWVKLVIERNASTIVITEVYVIMDNVYV